MGATLSRLWAALFHIDGRRHGRNAPLPFAYDKPVDDTSIRLLQFVRPRWFTFRLTRPQLVMATYPIDGLPKYVALSYTWGPPQQNDGGIAVVNNQHEKLPVQINGQTFSVFQNLKDALDGLYSFWDFDDDVQHMWIDAISINQDDLTERSIQVDIMDHIYKRAATTAVWLGRANADITKAMRMSTALLRIPVEDFTPYRQLNPPPAEFWRARGLPCPDADEHWAPLVRLFQNRWFSRAWIIQEVTLSKKVIIICGHHGMTWDGLGHVAFACHTARLGQLDALPAMARYLSGEEGLAGMDDWVVHDPVGNTFQLWLNRHRYLQRIDAARPGSDSADKPANVTDTLLEDMRAMTGCTRDTASAWLMYLCLNSRCADATDLRDKVFSHLGLVNNIAQQEGLHPVAIHATYAPAITPSHVYEQTMQRLVEETDSLAVLMALNDPPSLRLASLPSWVPDLSRRQGLDLMWSIRPRFNAAGNHLRPPNKPAKLQIANHRLLANSTTLATITTLSISAADLLGPNWHQFTTHLLTLPPMYKYPRAVAPETRIEAFWRTLLMNAVAKVHPAAWPSESSSSSPGAMFRAYVLQSLARYFPCPSTSTSTSTSTAYQANINALALADPTGTMPSFHSQADLLSQIIASTADLKVDDKDHDESDRDPGLPTQESAVLAALAACVDRASAFLFGMDGSMVNRRIAFTDAGHVANVPLWAEVGDRVVVLDSCPCPLVLRLPQPGTGEDGLACFALVGSAYVHGVMYGEGVGGDTVWERVCIV
ncbi:heterokaryon incompatibility protein-domain-containing protein [Podospora appendiculata]|uniref:Heterokaryon incompatibility protein-domain-containing protein n=1 Tax=Podospora appendiculata TaxID=314037 RepID=A0AAE0WYH1_9PEZI|nr:heterokaryon incompatibility protein-domain-containing protein [Podospora appendiculata]